MSLLGSIFGGEKSKDQKKANVQDKEEHLTGLFTQSKELPDRPQHEPKPRKAKRKSEEKEEVEKKRRKPRKPKKEESEETKTGDEVDASNDNENKGDEPEARTVFVGNLPLQGTTRKMLAALFKDCGKISSTRIRSVPVKGIKLPPQRAGDQNLMKKVCVNTDLVDYESSAKNTVQGYVVFKDMESVEKALELNNELVVDGRQIRVDRASPTIEPTRSVFCGNLPYGADETSLREHFVKGCDFEAGDVEGVRIIRDKETFQCKGFGYVLLRERSLVPTALKLHESMYMKKSIRVLVCGKRFKNKKGRDNATKQSRPLEKIEGSVSAPKETVNVGAFRRIIAKQQKEASQLNKRKRGEKKKTAVTKKGGTPGLSKRAAMEKKVEKRVKKIQKRISKGMGKARR